MKGMEIEKSWMTFRMEILTTWDHRERPLDCLLSALSCDGKSRTDPRSLSAPLGRWCVLVIATFSPDSWNLQFSSTFWKPLDVTVFLKEFFVKVFRLFGFKFKSKIFLEILLAGFTSFYMISLAVMQTCVIFSLRRYTPANCFFFFIQHEIAGVKRFFFFSLTKQLQTKIANFHFFSLFFRFKIAKRTVFDSAIDFLFNFTFFSFCAKLIANRSGRRRRRRKQPWRGARARFLAHCATKPRGRTLRVDELLSNSIIEEWKNVEECCV